MELVRERVRQAKTKQRNRTKVRVLLVKAKVFEKMYNCQEATNYELSVWLQCSGKNPPGETQGLIMRHLYYQAPECGRQNKINI